MDPNLEKQRGPQGEVGPGQEVERKPVPAEDPDRSAGTREEHGSDEEVGNPPRLRPFEGPSGTPGMTGTERVIRPVHPSSDLYPGVHVR